MSIHWFDLFQIGTEVRAKTMAAAKDNHALLEDVFYVVLVIHLYRYQKGGRGGGCPNISQYIEGGGWS